MARGWFRISVALGFLFTANGCFTEKKVNVNSYQFDFDPPALTWKVTNSNSGDILPPITNDGKVVAKQGDRYTIWLLADDDGGIQQIQLSATTTSWGCSQGDIGQQKGPTLAVPISQTFAPDANGLAATEEWLFCAQNIGPFDCQQGFTFAGATQSIAGEARDYSGNTTAGKLTFLVNP